MSVRWNWKRKMGSFIAKNPRGQKYTINLYAGNCLAVLLYEYKGADGKDMYEFHGFFNDTIHIKRCLGLLKYTREEKENLYKDAIKWKLNSYYPESMTIARAVAKSGGKVELYYKEPKE